MIGGLARKHEQPSIFAHFGEAIGDHSSRDVDWPALIISLSATPSCPSPIRPSRQACLSISLPPSQGISEPVRPVATQVRGPTGKISLTRGKNRASPHSHHLSSRLNDTCSWTSACIQRDLSLSPTNPLEIQTSFLVGLRQC